MTDPLRSDRPAASRDASERDRDARVEVLLLTGLDHYFSGQYERAINVWTRVLFLDRGHVKARAYIERARAALAEGDREADELFHTGADALNRGDREAARQLLTSALDRGVSGEDALALLYRMDRIEVASADLDVPSTRATGSSLPIESRRDPRVLWAGAGILAGVVLASVAAGYLWMVSEPFEARAGGRAGPVLQESLPVPTPGEIRLQRARYLMATGRLHEALRVLETEPVDEQYRVRVDDLRAGIQRRLLEQARRPEAPSR